MLITRASISLQCRNGPLPIIESSDPVDREVDFVPPKAPHDPRHFICGTVHPGKNFLLDFHHYSLSYDSTAVDSLCNAKIVMD